MSFDRIKLPDRRPCITQKVKIIDPQGKSQTFYLSFGYYPNGRVGEIWLVASKQGTFLRGVLDTLARTVSLHIQRSTPLEEICKILNELEYPPEGTVIGSEIVTYCKSISDWVAQELKAEYERVDKLLSETPTVKKNIPSDYSI